MCRFFARSHEIHLAAFVTPEELVAFDEPEMAIFKSWKLFPVSTKTRIAGLLQAPFLPLQIAARTSRTFRRYLRDLHEAHHFDVVILDHTNLYQYEDLFASSSIVVGNAHDILTQSWERHAASVTGGLKRIWTAWERDRVQRWEKKAIHALDFLVVPSGKDKIYAENKFSLQRAPVVINPWVHRISCLQQTEDVPKLPKSLLFWGAMDRQENIDAAVWAAKTILPLIRQSVSDAGFYIAGNRSKDLEPQLGQCEGVVLLGFIDDVAAMMRSMEIALLPLRLGAGIKVKTLECMDAGMPVITTEVGAEGIDGTNDIELMIRSSAEELAQASVELLLNGNRARTIGDAGQRMVQRQYDFDGRLMDLDHLLLDSMSKRRSE